MKARKGLALFLSIAMILSMLSLTAFAAEGEPAVSFPDAADSWAKSSIERWAGYGIVKGDEKGNVNPAADLTRGELAQMFVNLFGLSEKAENTYADLEGGEWYADAILKCTAAGIMQGDGANCNGNAHITRAEVMVMFGRAMGVAPAAEPDLSKFTDSAEVPDWAAGYMAPLVEMGVVSGVSDGVIAATINIDRASTLALLDKAIVEYVNAPGEVALDASKGFVVVNVSDKEAGAVLTGSAANVVVAAGAADGKVVLKDLTAGNVTMAGAADLSVEGKSDVSALSVDAAGSVAIAKDAKVGSVAVNAEAKLENAGTVTTLTANAAAEITNTGKVTDMVLEEAAKVTNDGTVTNLTANAPAEIVNTGKVTTLTANAAAEVDNKGTVSKAEIKADGVVLDGKKPSNISVDKGVKNPTNSDGKEVKPGSSGSSGGGGGTTYYTVTYDANGGTGAPAAVSKASGSTITLPVKSDVTAPEDKFLASWNTKADGTGDHYPLGGSYTVSGSVTLYAQWSTIDVDGVIDDGISAVNAKIEASGETSYAVLMRRDASNTVEVQIDDRSVTVSKVYTDIIDTLIEKLNEHKDELEKITTGDASLTLDGAEPTAQAIEDFVKASGLTGANGAIAGGDKLAVLPGQALTATVHTSEEPANQFVYTVKFVWPEVTKAGIEEVVTEGIGSVNAIIKDSKGYAELSDLSAEGQVTVTMIKGDTKVSEVYTDIFQTLTDALKENYSIILTIKIGDASETDIGDGFDIHDLVQGSGLHGAGGKDDPISGTDAISVLDGQQVVVVVKDVRGAEYTYTLAFELMDSIPDFIEANLPSVNEELKDGGEAYAELAVTNAEADSANVTVSILDGSVQNASVADAVKAVIRLVSDYSGIGSYQVKSTVGGTDTSFGPKPSLESGVPMEVVTAVCDALKLSASDMSKGTLGSFLTAMGDNNTLDVLAYSDEACTELVYTFHFTFADDTEPTT